MPHDRWWKTRLSTERLESGTRMTRVKVMGFRQLCPHHSWWNADSAERTVICWEEFSIYFPGCLYPGCAGFAMHLLLYTLLAVAVGNRPFVTATTCSQPNKYGPQCAYDCHCSMDCDKTTGLCPGTCILPWSGPSCQRENVALSKPTQNGGVFEYNSAWSSDKAVDGNTNQDNSAHSCYLSSYYRPRGQRNSPARDAWMVVDLGQEYHTHDISVYGRATFGHRLNGTRLFVSNVSNDRQNPCFTFEAPGNRTNDTWDLTCDRRGRYVTFFDDTLSPVDLLSGTVFLEICEVMVFVCSTGTFGSSCDQLCRCRDGSPCDFNGTCPNGCLDGFVGPTCSQACPNGTFGENCTQSCYCKSGTCDVTTGLCNGSCASGWRGPTCSQACGNGTWGEDCVGVCNCLGDPCDPQTGLCPGPCAPGWQDTHCDQQCPVGQFGQNCSRSCFCLEQPCNHVTGFCNSSCEPGWLGSSCSTPCPAESFGANCSLECHCQGQTCNGSTGLCPGVCQPGWLGVSCNVSCSADSFGANCTSTCRCKEGTCDHVTGLGCQGCEAGFQGSTCSAPCGPTQFGENCSSICNCDSPGCDALNGTCLVPGCLPGFHGDNCSIGCQTGSWGADCLQTCGNCSSPCDPRDGTCDTCLPGWEGDRCQAVGTESGSSGSSTTGTVIRVIIGCIVVVVVVDIAIVLGILIVRSRRSRRSKNLPSAQDNGITEDHL